MSDRPSGGALILIVEDDHVVAGDLRDSLIGFGYSVRLAPSAEDALATFETTHVDLVLLSLLLPDTDGLILCASLKGRTAAPIIILSERPREVDRLLAIALGATDLLVKPVDLDALRGCIEAVLVDRKDRAPVGRSH